MKLINEASPHFHGKGSTQWIMGMVCLSLVPTLVASLFLYGVAAPLLVLVCISTALVTEHVCCLLMHRESTAGDFSCVVTAMLLAFTLPTTCSYFAAILGTVFAVGVVKMLFGGIGCNIANPAVAGRIFIMVALPVVLGSYPDIIGKPLDAITGATPLANPLTITQSLDAISSATTDAVTSATTAAGAAGAGTSYLDLLLGAHAGALGETCVLTLLVGYIFLLVIGVVDAWATGPFIATVAVLTALGGMDPLYQMLSGGVALGGFYMVTDYTTTPMTKKGKIIFGIGCGVITALVRLFASAPEGVAFSILFMNMFTPLIDRFTRTMPAGGVKHALI